VRAFSSINTNLLAEHLPIIPTISDAARTARYNSRSAQRDMRLTHRVPNASQNSETSDTVL